MNLFHTTLLYLKISMIQILVKLLVIPLLFQAGVSLAQHSEERDTSTKTSVVIRVIQGGPCGKGDPALVNNEYSKQTAIHLDMACSCFQPSLARKEEQL